MSQQALFVVLALTLAIDVALVAALVTAALVRRRRGRHASSVLVSRGRDGTRLLQRWTAAPETGCGTVAISSATASITSPTGPTALAPVGATSASAGGLPVPWLPTARDEDHPISAIPAAVPDASDPEYGRPVISSRLRRLAWEAEAQPAAETHARLEEAPAAARLAPRPGRFELEGDGPASGSGDGPIEARFGPDALDVSDEDLDSSTAGYTFGRPTISDRRDSATEAAFGAETEPGPGAGESLRRFPVTHHHDPHAGRAIESFFSAGLATGASAMPEDRAARNARAGRDVAGAMDASDEPRTRVTPDRMAGHERRPRAGGSDADEPLAEWRDPLTGLDGPLAWDWLLRAESSRFHRYRRPVTVVVGDVDGLWRLADGFGEESAERLLLALAATFRREARAADRIARLAWSKFAVLLPETGEAEARNYVERVRSSCDGWLEAGAVALRLSLGWASPPSSGELELAVRRAEARMHEDRRRVGRVPPTSPRREDGVSGSF